ncbi:cytochrome P450 CYP736A12-like [Prosopis cineraria]|uniref:cytochrome P450 CYP736A12-like n=1 Tax=Prosopis cineraria TaxID=364024 RepID=UPI00240EFC79|nr:cytochrome P450 CYP736A12-like [Prosopis cineraria]
MLPPILPFYPLILLALLFIISALLLSHLKRAQDARKQPPGPPAWPVIGNLHLLGTLPHRSLQSLAKHYGPFMSLRLGQVPTIVISSPEAAELVLRTYDTIFAGRPKTQASQYLFYDSKGLAFSDCGPYWRSVRKFCNLQLLSASKVEMFGPIRKEEVGELMKSIAKSAAAREVVDLTEKVEKVVQDVMYRIILGRKRDDGLDAKRLVRETLRLAGAFNPADYVPSLGPFDILGLAKQLKRNGKELDEMLETIIKEHEEEPNEQKKQQKDFVDVLLTSSTDLHDNQQSHAIDRTNIKAILLDMIIGATDTSISVTLWAFSELLRNPRVMKKLQNELENVIGMNKPVDISDLPKLSYLDMVIKETSRLYPVLPLLIPRVSVEDITINGYYIRKNTQIMVNIWAIGRDPEIWSENAEVFYPERFMNSNMDLKGHDFQLLPFGSGRRVCPGMQSGLTGVKFLVAQLVHCFNWELPPGMSPSDVDMTEKFGLTMPRANHLLALPSHRLPGPPSWPVIGNLHLLGTLPHRSLQSLAKHYGPIMSLRLGQVPAVVVSSPEAAELFLKTHDVVFASRPASQASEFLAYGSRGLPFIEYGPYWRSMRKLCTVQLLSASKVEMFSPLRREELGQLVKSLEKSAAAREAVDVTEKVGRLVEDIMYKVILGRNRYDRFDLKGLIREALTLVGAFNVADFVPFLGPLDIQGIRRRMLKTSKELDEILETIMREHEVAPVGQNGRRKDFVDILLSCMNTYDDQHNFVIDRTNIKAILLDMIAASFDTSAAVVLWAIPELLRNPRVMKKLQHELEVQVGKTRMVEEADLPRLSYLDMVIKETMRLYPVGPLLLPRVCREDITINGYRIKKNSRLIVNVWAIGRDPKTWSDNVESFCPERFLNSNIDFGGHDFEFLPFGSGRRGCAGIQLGLITVKLILAQLVHCFNWELPDGMSPDELDMSETFGLSMPRADHLLAVPSYRLLIN